MTVLQRIPLAVRYIFSGKSAYDMLPIGVAGEPVYDSAGFYNNVTKRFRKNELIYSCTMYKADSAASAKLKVYTKGTEDDVDDHPIRMLLEQPNPFLTEFDFFALILIHLDLAGRSYWEKVRSRAGKVVQLWPLRPDWMYPIPSSTAGLLGYEYRVPGKAPIRLRVEDVLDFKLHDPLEMYGGLAPISIAARVGDVDNATTDFIKLLFEHGGMPPGILKSKLKLHDDDVTSIRARWKERYGGFTKWTQPAVLDMDAEYQRTSLDMREMGFDWLDGRSEARICQVLRVPPILVGAKVGLDRSTFSNYGEARSSFWEDTLMPQYKRIRDELQSDLVPEFGGNVRLDWDMSNVPALQEDQTAKWGRAQAALTGGGITVNEFRHEIGLEDIGPSGDVFLRTIALQAIPVGVIENPMEPAPQEDQPEEDNPPEDVAKSNGHRHEYKAAPANAPDEADRKRDEKKIAKVVQKAFDEQFGRVKTALGEMLGQPVLE